MPVRATASGCVRTADCGGANGSAAAHNAALPHSTRCSGKRQKSGSSKR